MKALTLSLPQLYEFITLFIFHGMPEALSFELSWSINSFQILCDSAKLKFQFQWKKTMEPYEDIYKSLIRYIYFLSLAKWNLHRKVEMGTCMKENLQKPHENLLVNQKMLVILWLVPTYLDLLLKELFDFLLAKALLLFLVVCACFLSLISFWNSSSISSLFDCFPSEESFFALPALFKFFLVTCDLLMAFIDFALR